MSEPTIDARDNAVCVNKMVFFVQLNSHIILTGVTHYENYLVLFTVHVKLNCTFRMKRTQ